MTDSKRILTGLLLWTIGLSTAHAWLNIDWSVVANNFVSEGQRKLNVAYIPVT